MDLLSKFAGNVRRVRARKKLPQKALAARVGISVSYVSMLERGQRSPPLETIEKMARALRGPPGSLFDGREPGRESRRGSPRLRQLRRRQALFRPRREAAGYNVPGLGAG